MAEVYLYCWQQSLVLSPNVIECHAQYLKQSGFRARKLCNPTGFTNSTASSACEIYFQSTLRGAQADFASDNLFQAGRERPSASVFGREKF
ncbi:hypothetical protein PsB1_1989 [Candidatus Phycosocius spiralis]|uniref:Uncharacterized protein n=1 Tax=Candidatus Phycosocius spiralis TaxID=2815099 RepID=A0ABQ4PY46_9PROT|nr:hypothetical protein PsB1_1989 [Candidatus Phycosocius spiralis]